MAAAASLRRFLGQVAAGLRLLLRVQEVLHRGRLVPVVGALGLFCTDYQILSGTPPVREAPLAAEAGRLADLLEPRP